MKKIITAFDRIHDPLLNKDTAFSLEEREKYNLIGLLPDNVETIEDQLVRVRDEIAQKNTDIEKHIYLRALQDHNEVLFYRFVVENIDEMLPLIYTPVVGEACEHFFNIYRQPRGIYISYSNKDNIDEIFSLIAKERDIRVIVVTDGERILGLGDQGVGGLGIPIGKLSLYTAVGGVHPKYTLPVILDVGTNNIEKLENPQYLGLRNTRITGVEYTSFLDIFVDAVKKNFPKVLLQFEDFAQQHAYPLLDRYHDKLCTFNDDIQGTASVVVAAVLAAVQVSGKKLADQKIAVLGAGSAGCGISAQLIKAFVAKGISETDARDAFYLIDRNGLLHDEMTNILPFQKPFLRNHSSLKSWGEKNKHLLLDVVKNAKPTILIGVSGQANQFTKDIVEAMLEYCKRPIIFPLSNPTSHSEAAPADLITWSKGGALIATGSPYSDVSYKGKEYKITQSNNVYIFPAMGLAVLAGKINRVTDSMMLAAAMELSTQAKKVNLNKTSLLPELSQIRVVSEHIAIAIINQAVKEGYSKIKPQEVDAAIKKYMWYPEYD
ncbi:MAG: NAD-dependent malic enzyme [Legionellaceae bacterium]|nr:NAD-dependent malic enzyme [Legionellaceae bacterium]